MRTAEIARQTNETQIDIKLDLDGLGNHKISTGIGFLDHMLTHLAVHGLFDLSVQAKGDLHIDTHHTVEDVALALGQAFDQALGDRKGIVRMGDCFAPMDETLAHVALDLSGRPYSVVQAEWHTPYIGDIPTTLFPHFFSRSQSPRVAIYMRACCMGVMTIIRQRRSSKPGHALWTAQLKLTRAAQERSHPRKGH